MIALQSAFEMMIVLHGLMHGTEGISENYPQDFTLN